MSSLNPKYYWNLWRFIRDTPPFVAGIWREIHKNRVKPSAITEAFTLLWTPLRSWGKETWSLSFISSYFSATRIVPSWRCRGTDRVRPCWWWFRASSARPRTHCWWTGSHDPNCEFPWLFSFSWRANDAGICVHCVGDVVELLRCKGSQWRAWSLHGQNYQCMWFPWHFPRGSSSRFEHDSDESSTDWRFHQWSDYLALS